MNRILLVEDNPGDVALMRAAFARHADAFSLEVADSLTAARQLLEGGGMSLLIVDLVLPDGSGADLIQLAQARGCPSIVLTGHGDEASAVLALRAGALDYVVKSGEQIADMPHVAARLLREWAILCEREYHVRLLAESEERFQTFAELAADWFWETDADLHMTFFSEGFCHFSSIEPERLIGMPMSEAMAACDPALDWSPVAERWQQRDEFELMLEQEGNSHPTRSIYLRGIPFFGDDQSFRGYRGIARDIARDREIVQQMANLATYDSLTGVLNRRSFEAALKATLHGLSRQHEDHAFCFFDVDGFKQINDAYGHVAGDAVLREIAQALAREIRAGDSVGRLGGDEFGLLLRHCTLGHGLEVALKIVEAVAARPFAVAGFARPRISAGVVPLQLERNATQILRAANHACHRAKRAGGGTVAGPETG